MDSKNLERIAYAVSPSSSLAFSSKRIAVNFVPRGECTNKCLFCTPNIPAMKEIVQGEVSLEEEYSASQMVSAVAQAYEQNPDCSEIIITGTIGEPLLHFERLIEFIPMVKQKTQLPVRLNTNGQASIILPEYPLQETCKLLEEARLDSMVISLNSINEQDYNKLCRPNQQQAFNSVLGLVRASNQSGIETYVSFVDYSGTHEEFPRMDKERIRDFCRTLGLKDEQIIYRPLIE